MGCADVTRKGEWMAAVLACAPVAVLSHYSAAALWRIHNKRGRDIHVSVPRWTGHRQAGIIAHRRKTLRRLDVTRRDNIPVTTPILTLIDLDTCVPAGPLEAAINEADKLDLVDPPRLRRALDARKGQRGTGPLRAILDRGTFVLTDTELERHFLRSPHVPGSPRHGRRTTSTDSGSTSTGPVSAWSWKRTAFATAEPHKSRQGIVCEIRLTHQRGSLRCGSPTGRFATTPNTSRGP